MLRVDYKFFDFCEHLFFACLLDLNVCCGGGTNKAVLAVVFGVRTVASLFV